MDEYGDSPTSTPPMIASPLTASPLTASPLTASPLAISARGIPASLANSALLRKVAQQRSPPSSAYLPDAPLLSQSCRGPLLDPRSTSPLARPHPGVVISASTDGAFRRVASPPGTPSSRASPIPPLPPSSPRHATTASGNSRPCSPPCCSFSLMAPLKGLSDVPAPQVAAPRSPRVSPRHSPPPPLPTVPSPSPPAGTYGTPRSPLALGTVTPELMQAEASRSRTPPERTRSATMVSRGILASRAPPPPPRAAPSPVQLSRSASSLSREDEYGPSSPPVTSPRSVVGSVPRSPATSPQLNASSRYPPGVCPPVHSPPSRCAPAPSMSPPFAAAGGEPGLISPRYRPSNASQQPPLPSRSITLPGINMGDRFGLNSATGGVTSPRVDGQLSPSRRPSMVNSPTPSTARTATSPRAILFEGAVLHSPQQSPRSPMTSSASCLSVSISGPVSSACRLEPSQVLCQSIQGTRSLAVSSEEAEIKRRMSVHRRVPPPFAAPVPREEAAFAAAAFGESGLVGEVSKVLCECMVAELKKGIKLQRLPDFSETICRLAQSQGSGSPAELELTVSPCDTSNFEPMRFPTSAISGVCDNRIGDGKPIATLTFRNGMPPLSFQSKDRTAFVNFVDGLGSVLSQPILTKERLADLVVLKEVFQLTHAYGRPSVPPLPSL